MKRSGPAGDRQKLRVQRLLQPGERMGERLGEVPVLTRAETVPAHVDCRPEPRITTIEMRFRATTVLVTPDPRVAHHRDGPALITGFPDRCRMVEANGQRPIAKRPHIEHQKPSRSLLYISNAPVHRLVIALWQAPPSSAFTLAASRPTRPAFGPAGAGSAACAPSRRHEWPVGTALKPRQALAQALERLSGLLSGDLRVVLHGGRELA